MFGIRRKIGTGAASRRAVASVQVGGRGHGNPCACCRSSSQPRAALLLNPGWAHAIERGVRYARQRLRPVRTCTHAWGPAGQHARAAADGDHAYWQSYPDGGICPADGRRSGRRRDRELPGPGALSDVLRFTDVVTPATNSVEGILLVYAAPTPATLAALNFNAASPLNGVAESFGVLGLSVADYTAVQTVGVPPEQASYSFLSEGNLLPVALPS